MRLLSSGLVVGLLLALLFGHRYVINITDSLPRGLYQKTSDPLQRGAIVTECLPPDWAAFGKERGYLQGGGCPGGVMPLLKEVVGIPGDEIDLVDAYVAVNGHVLLNSETRAVDSKGRPIPAIPRGRFILQDDQVFLLARNSERSWDSRYTGPVEMKDVQATVKPVWTEASNGF